MRMGLRQPPEQEIHPGSRSGYTTNMDRLRPVFIPPRNVRIFANVLHYKAKMTGRREPWDARPSVG